MRLIIKKLFGKYDYDIDFNKPINILIGENGCGKSTILKILYYLGKRDFISLANVKFEQIIVSNEKYSETIVRDALLQHAFVNNIDFKRNLYKFIVEYLDVPYSYLPEYSFKGFYRELLNLFSKGERVLNDLSVVDADEYINRQLSDDIMFFFGKKYDHNHEFVFEFDVEEGPYYEYIKLLTNNRCIYGSVLYFKVIYEFFVLFFRFKNETGIENANEIYYEDYKFFPKKLYSYCKRLDKIVGSSNIYDYVDFEEKGYNVLNQFKNISFFNADTVHSMVDKVCELMGDKKEPDYKSGIVISEIKGWEKIKDFCTSLIHDGESRKHAIFHFRYDGTNEISVKREKWNDFVSRLHPDCIGDAISCNYFFTGGYNYQKVFDYIEKNYETLTKDNSQLHIFNTLIQRYISNKKIKIDEEKLSIIHLEEMDIFDITDKNGIKIEYDQLSSGEKKIIRLIMMIAFDIQKYKLLLIDEPELSLSPFWQEMLLDDIENYCKECKVIIATQSPNLINDDQLDWLIEIKKEA